MRHVTIAAFVAALSACAYQPELAITAGARRVDGEHSPGACLIVTQRLSDRYDCRYIHCSDPESGQPFNDRYDVSDDVLGCGVSWGGAKRD